MKCLNASYKLSCLQCSFSDKELGEYIQRDSTQLPQKFAVQVVGQQSDGSWVLVSNAYLTSSGDSVDLKGSKYIWLDNIFSGPGVASNTEQCSIELLLTTDPLCSLMETLRDCMSYNFMPCVMTLVPTMASTLVSTILSLHYQSMLKKLKFCPVPLHSGIQAIALFCSLALLGANDTRFYSKITKEKALSLCSTSSIPLGVDDPQSKGDISRLIIDLYNGTRSGMMGCGGTRPTSMCIISANFTTVDQQRYVLQYYTISCRAATAVRTCSRLDLNCSIVPL